MSSPRSTRHRGGQPGNSNRLRHGLYSRRQPPAGDHLDPDFQVALARSRLAQLLQKQESSTSPRDWLSYEHGILHYISLIIYLQQFRTALRRPTELYPTEHDGHPSEGVLESLLFQDDGATDASAAADNAIRTSAQTAPDSRHLLMESPVRTADSFPRTRSSEPADQERL